MNASLPPFGSVLRRLRQERNLSQEELAARLEVSPSHISRMESDFKKPNLEMIFGLAEAFDIKPHEIIKAMESQAHELWKSSLL